MSELFKSWKWPRDQRITEDQRKSAEHAISRWQAVQKILATDGWKYIKDEIEAEFNKANSIVGVAPDKLAEKQGYCLGVGYILTRIQSYKHAAEEGVKILELAGPTEE